MPESTKAIAEYGKTILTNKGLDFAIIIPTANGLNKSIMDATGQVRAFLLKNNIHNYAEQHQGKDNKVIIPAYFITDTGLLETKASLYRPKTKEGDPRIWISGLTSFCRPLDTLALLTDGQFIYVANLSNEKMHTHLSTLDFSITPDYSDMESMVHEEKLFFSTNAKLGKLLGRELITNSVIAVFELIKNSYDAFAPEVIIEFIDFDTDGTDSHLHSCTNQVLSNETASICITDNGIGMTFDDIKTKWMQVGTTSKENATVREFYRDGHLIRRAINGEKGIGRFGTDKLGAVLHMESVAKLNDRMHEISTLEINWNSFNDHSMNFQDFSFLGKSQRQQIKPEGKTGLSLKMTQLREKWTGSDILKLKKHMKKLISPFSQDEDEFKIYLKFGDRLELVTNDSLDFADTGIEATISEDGLMHYALFDREERFDNTADYPRPSFGPISLKILYMDKVAKMAFTKNNKFSFREYGNIKLFRDNFRILPYGDHRNDWLGIDSEHAQAVFRSLGTRDIIGYIQISKEHNPKLRDATNRQGLNEDTAEFVDFRTFIWICLDLLSNFIFDKIKHKAEQQGKLIESTVAEISEEIDLLKKSLPRLYNSIDIPLTEKNRLVDETIKSFVPIEKNIKNVYRANKQLENQLSVFAQIAGTENMLYDIVHAIKNKLAVFEALIDTIFTKYDIDEEDPQRIKSEKLMRELNSIAFAALKRTTPQRKEREIVDLAEFIKTYVRELEIIYPELEIQSDVLQAQMISCNLDGLKIMFDNLLNNSMKAMESCENKKLWIRLDRDGRSASITFSDNGVGISNENRPFVFTATFSKTSGTGIGLSSASHYVLEHGGTINLLTEAELGGATFKIALPLLNQ